MTTASLLSRALIPVEQRNSWLLAAWRANSYSGQHWSIENHWRSLNWAALLGPLSFSISWLNVSVNRFTTQVISLQVLKGKKKTVEQATGCNWVVFYGALYVLIITYLSCTSFTSLIGRMLPKVLLPSSAPFSQGEDGDAEEALREAKERLAERLQVWDPRNSKMEAEEGSEVCSIFKYVYVYILLYLYVCKYILYVFIWLFIFPVWPDQALSSCFTSIGKENRCKSETGILRSKVWWGKVFPFDFFDPVCLPNRLAEKPTILSQSNTSTVPSTRSKGPPKQAVGRDRHEFLLFSGYSHVQTREGALTRTIE